MKPNPRQIFVLGDLLERGKSEAAKERNFKVCCQLRDVLQAYLLLFINFQSKPGYLFVRPQASKIN